MERERERNEVRKPKPRIIWACACGKTHRFRDYKGEWAGCGFHCTRHPGTEAAKVRFPAGRTGETLEERIATMERNDR
jgi:hypothetical protein